MTDKLVVAYDMKGNPVRVGDEVTFAVVTGFSTKRAELRIGRVVSALVDTKGTRLRIYCDSIKGNPYRTTRDLSKLLLLRY